MIKDLGGVEVPKLPTILEADEDSNARSVDSTQQKLDNISREPHKFTYSIVSYC